MLTLQVGQVFRLWCAVTVPPKWKYHVLAQIDPRPRFFLINTHAAAFQLANPALAMHQLAVTCADHAFLHHDSVLDLSQLMGGPASGELENSYSKDKSVLLGALANNSRRAARSVIQRSTLLTPKEIATLLALW
jgi:hypothetical protein